MPRRQTDALLGIFAGVFVLGVVGLRSMPGALQSIFDYLRLSLFYAAAMLAYVISYSAIEAQSPSCVLVLKIAQAGKEGLAKGELEAAMTDEVLVSPRLNDLVRDGLVVIRDDKYELTAKGDCFIGIFIVFRKLLGAVKGG